MAHCPNEVATAMKFDLKTTIICSALLAAGLNLWQFFASYRQREAAFVPAWAADAASSSVAARATPAPARLAAASAPAAESNAAASTVAPAPVADPVAAAAARLRAAGLSPAYAALYLSVQRQTGTPWQLLAAVHRAETGQSGSTTRTSYAGATGPMQFMPATFAYYALDGNGDGTKDIHNLDDAMLTAGRYLAAGGASSGRYSAALYNYNHSNSYVASVLVTARRLGL